MDIVILPDGTVVCATTSSIFTFIDPEWQRIFPTSGDLDWLISDLALGTDGRLWAASVWGMISGFDSSWTLYGLDSVASELGASLPDLRVVPVPDRLSSTETLHYGSLGLERSGATVVGVIPGSPADSAGT